MLRIKRSPTAILVHGLQIDYTHDPHSSHRISCSQRLKQLEVENVAHLN